jgi:predicted nucleic acid-binding protein
MITISGKTLGRKKPLFADWSIPLPPDLGDGGLTLRDLIGRIVRTEVEAFRQRQQERRVFRALTADDIARGAVKGKIDMGGHDLQQDVDAEEAVAIALQAFEDGLYLVVVDEEDKRELDQRLFLKPDSCVTFIRLAMLAGG